MKRIAFITGARSDYGVMKRVITELVLESDFSVSIVATGMHYQHKYGYTIDSVRHDALAPIIDAPCYSEVDQPKEKDFVALINVINSVFDKHPFDIVYIVGDRLEAYASALAAHFHKIPIVHYAGGQITNGAVDNIYRYNISNLSKIHLVTNIYAAERLKNIPIINREKVFFVGSSAIDSIKSYLQHPKDASLIDSRLTRGKYILMTFHSETMSEQQKNTIPEVMDTAIKTIVENGVHVLVTYPNNDDGSLDIIDIIKKWQDDPFIIVRKNLGAELYYVAVDNSMFVIGNSSSGIIEIPYFQKYTINVGERQSGRNAPKSVINVPDDCMIIKESLEKYINQSECVFDQVNIYGIGNSINMIRKVLSEEF